MCFKKEASSEERLPFVLVSKTLSKSMLKRATSLLTAVFPVAGSGLKPRDMAALDPIDMMSVEKLASRELLSIYKIMSEPLQ